MEGRDGNVKNLCLQLSRNGIIVNMGHLSIGLLVKKGSMGK